MLQGPLIVYITHTLRALCRLFWSGKKKPRSAAKQSRVEQTSLVNGLTFAGAIRDT